VVFFHRIAAIRRDGNKHGSDSDTVLRVGSGNTGGCETNGRAILCANLRGHLDRNGRINGTALGEQHLVDTQNRRLHVGRINNRSPDDNSRRSGGVHECRTDQPARQRFGDGDRFAGSRERVNQPRNAIGGGVIHQAQPRIAFHTYSSPVHTVSATAATIRNPLNQFIQSPSSAGNGASANDTAIDCAVVLTLPPHDAA